MREEHLVFLVYLPITLLLFALLAARDIPPLTGRRAAPAVEKLVRQAIASPAQTSKRTRTARLLGWTAFTQVAPVLVALSDAPTPIRAASAAEIVAAVAWGAYLARSPHVTFTDAE